ncbi:swi5-dependent recombination DNA repair protein 1 homolog [Macrobrachium nipponense]|uniref:swi5-dependent recombination DNA repair protein 1 homolog n=1 Tax=Macrobrachium nipponense TaxID=159736 RepID=UPI0030C80BB1
MPPEKRKLESLIQNENNEDTSKEVTFKVPRKFDSSPINSDDYGKDLPVDIRIKEAKLRIKEKEDTLRKLKLVRMYRTKWETQDLDSVTAQWLRVCQEALEDLRSKVKETMNNESGQELTLAVLIKNLGLDPELLKLVEEEDCFAT